MMFADVTINQLRSLSKSAGALLSFTSKTKISIYWVNQGPVIFRSIVKRDQNAQFLMLSLKPSIELRSELGKEAEAEDLQKEIDAQRKIETDPNQLARIF